VSIGRNQTKGKAKWCIYVIVRATKTTAIARGEHPLATPLARITLSGSENGIAKKRMSIRKEKMNIY
jgi:hypothetical protein